MSTVWFRSFQSRRRFQTCLYSNNACIHLPIGIMYWKQNIIAWTMHPSAALQLFSHGRFPTLYYYYIIASMRCGNSVDSRRIEIFRFTLQYYTSYTGRHVSPQSFFPILPTRHYNIYPILFFPAFLKTVKTRKHINITTFCGAQKYNNNNNNDNNKR